ncbi:NAD(P)-binding oxidoreductase [Streptomyces sp. DSM 3412]|uniref:NAD(P)-binding oxidoreductase n=1 Tax=Streptomyces gottesmaniae TaxID=3075518 RepID=A0ABU2Z6N5_9ACTN|nr:NAD(P)-binding oxidoreductase [Streptomyces sp. DSM 3412]MDT0571995.1 NAD(P)-binding oxidoreductase [Streptomyces sp. DSM 3412]
MNLLILGATGPTGRHIVDLALRSGDKVTLLARRPEALVDMTELAGQADQVTVVAGDATSHHDVAKAMIGQDVVVAALGRSTSVRADDLFTRAAAAVVGAAKDVGVSRLVWLSSFGVGDTYRSASAVQKVIYSTLLRNIYANKEISEKAIRSSGLDWTLVYPTMLTKDPAKGTYRVGERLPMKGNPTISRADVADFMYKAARSTEWINRQAVITD